MQEDGQHLAFHILIRVFVRCDPRLACLHEVHGSVLRQEDHIRFWIRNGQPEPVQQSKAVGVDAVWFDAEGFGSEFVAQTIKPRGF
jgi:hypothetical protein